MRTKPKGVVIDSGRYGKVLAATFQRLSLTPTWSWKGWLMDAAKSGSAAVDLHIHDTEFVLACFAVMLPYFALARRPRGDDIRMRPEKRAGG